MPRVSVEEAAQTLRAGGLAGVPTETVYGLAADGLNEVAVRAIYARKGRPPRHPLILHLLDEPHRYGVLDGRARDLIAAFWPGPLTLVVPRRPIVPEVVTGGHPTVALRAPDHSTMQALLLQTDRPLAAPSANRFGRVSPTTAEHVLEEFPDLDVVDGGACLFGIESTIVDLSGAEASLLRLGALSAEALAAVVGPLCLGGPTAAPGTLAAHYAPSAQVHVTEAPATLAATLRAEGLRVGVLHALPAAEYAATLYARLRALDGPDVDVIVAELCRDGGLGDAVNDRLRRAAAAGVPVR